VKYFGYAGKTLLVDLNSQKIEVQALDMLGATKFIGGWGLSMKHAFDLIKPETGPLSPENPIIVAAGPLIGTITPASGKIVGTTKYPISGIIAGAVGGSNRFGVNLKKAGYDQIIIEGRSKNPVYLKIIDDEVGIHEAKTLWGAMDAYQTDEELRRKYHSTGGTISIGKAGENLSKISLSIVDKRGTLGRGGLGAVMGSKNLKAIYVEGTKQVNIRFKEKFQGIVEKIRKTIMNNEYYRNKKIFELGWSMVGWDSYRFTFTEGVWTHQKLDELYGVESFLQAKESVSGCSLCMYPCKASYKIKDGEFRGEGTETGHFTCIGVLGQKLGLTDFRQAIKLMDILNRSGICFYSFGAMVDFATRLFEHGLITTKETQGLELRREIETYSRLAEMINQRVGFGSTLADGWDKFSEETGIDPKKDYTEGRGIVRGSDCIFDARFKSLDPSTITEVVCSRAGQQPWGYFTTSKRLAPIEEIRGDCVKAHFPQKSIERIFSPFHDFKFNPGRLTKHVEDVNAVYNSLGICALYQIAGFINLELLAELYSAATGIDVKPDELKKRGEAAFNLNKIMNVKAGFSRKQDVFPESWFTPKDTPNGRAELKDYYGNFVIDRKTAYEILDEYYDERGWTIETGIPTKQKLEELGLAEYRDALGFP